MRLLLCEGLHTAAGRCTQYGSGPPRGPTPRPMGASPRNPQRTRFAHAYAWPFQGPHSGSESRWLALYEPYSKQADSREASERIGATIATVLDGKSPAEVVPLREV